MRFAAPEPDLSRPDLGRSRHQRLTIPGWTFNEGSQMEKNIARLRRAKSTRARIRGLGVPRLSVLRTGQHIYAQVFSADGARVLASASTVQADVREGLKSLNDSAAASRVGKLVAERARAAGIEQVAFDRSGYRYHGRIKALADAAREGGLKF